MSEIGINKLFQSLEKEMPYTGNPVFEQLKKHCFKLKAEKEKYEKIISLHELIVLECDKQGQLIGINECGQQIFDYQELKKRPIIHLLFNKALKYGLQPEKILAVLLKTANKNVSFHFQSGIITKDGRPTDVKWQTQIISNSSGQPEGVVFSGKKLQKKLSEHVKLTNPHQLGHHNLLRAQAIAKVTDWSFNVGDNCIRTSEQTARILGIDKALLKNFTFKYLQQFIHPADFNLFQQLMKELIQKQDGELLQWKTVKPGLQALKSTIEIRVVKTDNNILYINFRGERELDTNGNVIRVFGTAQDITERKKMELKLKDSEEKFRKLIESTIEGIAIIDKKGNIQVWNKAQEEITGIPAREAIQRNIYDIELEICPNQSCKEILHKEKSLGNSLPYKTFVRDKLIESHEKRIIARDGKEKILQWNSFEIKANDEYFYCTISHDLTAQIIAKRKLLKSESKLKNLNATKDNLLSVIAHDLKNPFNNIIGFSELLLAKADKYSKEKQKYYQSIILDTAQQSFSLLENLLAWSRNQTGHLHFQPEIINLKEAFQNCIELFDGNAKQKDIALLTTLTDGTLIEADMNMIDAILRNLVSNAIKFTPKGGKIYLRAADKGETIEISVVDNGVGLSEKARKKIFKHRMGHTSSGTNKEHGTGLGLVICKDFVEKHGGKIWFESKTGKGTTFTFTLPKIKRLPKK